MNFILTASNFVFPLVTFPYVSRVLGTSGNGKIAFITSVASYFSMIASLGIPTYGIRACATVRDDKEKLSKTVHELLLIHSIMTIVSLILFFASYILMGRLQREPELMFVNGISLLLNVLGANWLYSALEQYQYITFRSLAFKVISILLMFALVHKRQDYVIYGAISVFAVAGSNILNFINLRKFVSFKNYKSYNLKQHMKPILVFFAQTVAITVYTNLDTVMLGFMKTDAEVGLYSAAIRVKNILSTLVTSLGAVLLPRLSYYTANGHNEEFKRLIHKAMEIVFVMGATLTFYFMIMARDCIVFLSGNEFLGATLAMQIIIPTILFIGLSNITGLQVLTPLNKEKYVLISVVAGAVIDFAWNLLLIPRMGAAGAAIGTLLAEIAVLLVQWYAIRKVVHMRLVRVKEIVKIVGISGTMAILLWLSNGVISLTPVLKLITTGVAYFGSVSLLFVIFRVDIVRTIIGHREEK